MDAVANELRLAAYAADDAFHAELVRVYGKRAGDMRYQPNDFEDTALIAAHEAKRDADDAMHASFRAADPAPYCSYGHPSRAQCDCGDIASND